MRGAAAGLLLFVLAICGGARAQTPNPTYSPDDLAASPPGFYPGRAAKIGPAEADQYAKFLDDNRILIAVVHGVIASIHDKTGQSGCLDRTEWTCLATFASTMVVATGYSTDPGDQVLEKPRGGDVEDADGVPVDPLARIYLYGPGIPRPLLVRDMLGGKSIFSILIDLAADPFAAASPDDLRKTYLYQLASAVIGPACDLGPPASFYAMVKVWKRTDTLTPTLRSTHAQGRVCGARVWMTTIYRTVRGTPESTSNVVISVY